MFGVLHVFFALKIFQKCVLDVHHDLHNVLGVHLDIHSIIACIHCFDLKFSCIAYFSCFHKNSKKKFKNQKNIFPFFSHQIQKFELTFSKIFKIKLSLMSQIKFSIWKSYLFQNLFQKSNLFHFSHLFSKISKKYFSKIFFLILDHIFENNIIN